MKTEKEFPVIKNNVRGVNGNMEVDLERALDLCGAGKYQVYHCTIMIAILGASILELIGYSFILPAGACDLGLSDSLRGIITSLPNIGIIITAPFWGRAADALGRKPVLLYSTAMSGIVGLIASFMPGLFSFALCKFVGSLFISCASSLGFAYVGELMPRKRRDIAVLMCNAILMLLAALCPILAWGVLSYDWFDAISIHPWRVLTAVYAIPLILSALWLTQAKESPKFLMTKNKPREALEVLRYIYNVNTGYGEDNYCVTSISNNAEDSEKVMDSENTGRSNNSAFALLRPPHLKWMALTGFLMFGLFSLLNGLFLFAPNTINKMMTSSDEPVTICMILNQPVNQSEPTTCVDDISYGTFQITIVASLIYGTLVLLISLSPLSKKTLLVGMYTIIGGTCLVSAVTTNRIIAGISMSALQVTALGIGPLTAYSVQLFPTNLRGTAVGAVLMFGRVGSVVGANVSGVFLASACTTTFYVFAALLFICAGLSFLLPDDQSANNDR